MALTSSQIQIHEELQALILSWIDRGVLQRDVLNLFSTYAASSAVDSDIEIETFLYYIGKVYVNVAEHPTTKKLKAERSNVPTMGPKGQA